MFQSAALALASRGLKVFPLRPRDKRPATVNGLKAATGDSAQIERWWHEQPECNVAIATGAVSGVFVLDVDNGDCRDGEAALSKLEAQHGNLPATVESITGTGGRHLFFKMPDRDLRNSASRLASNLDIRANGGYVVAPPSLHPCGRAYCWSVDSAREFAAAPDWLLDKIAAPSTTTQTTAALPAQTWCDLILEGVDEGRRNESIARLAGHLLRHRVDAAVVLEICIAFSDARFRPPLSGDEILATVDSIAARELRRRGVR
jgi:Bifunctional DNA primase/polymerase, N-terminal/Primase C terminal 1 (PriCT-1)